MGAGWRVSTVALVVGWSVVVAAAPAVVAVDSAELRSAPYSIAPLLGSLARGQTLYVSSDVTNGWRGAQVSDGRSGYVHDADVQVDGEPLAIVRAKLAPSNAAPPRIAHPWIARFEIDLAGESGGFLSADENSASAMAITVGRSVTERFSTEMTIGLDPFPGDHDGNIAPGLVTMAVARMATVLDSRTGRHALTLAAGPMLIAGGRTASWPSATARRATSFTARTSPFCWRSVQT